MQTDRPAHILVVDDERSIRSILQEAMAYAGYECSTAADGLEALDVLNNKMIDVVITDIIMPRMNGIELAAIVKEKYPCDVIMMTGFSEDFSYEDVIERGVSDFMQKPVGVKELIIRVKRVLRERAILGEQRKFEFIVNTAKELIALVNKRYIYEVVNDSHCQLSGRSREEIVGHTAAEIWGIDLFQASLKESFDRCFEGHEIHQEVAIEFPHEGCRHFDIAYYPYSTDRMTVTHAVVVTHDVTERKTAEDKLKQMMETLRKAMGATVQAVAMTVEARDPYTAGHQRRVAQLAREMAREMGLSEETVEGIYIAGLIHDLGKISIPAEILSKPSRLTGIEYSLIQVHSQTGYDILKDIDFPWPVAQIMYQHHERLDGRGYPRGLKGDEIILEARIIAVADVVEAMASHRPYRPTLGQGPALEEISRGRGISYDASAVDACLVLFQEKNFAFQ